ncbi:hypothetical protein P0136_12055 [Lentisphaerota bacterium ZTH]|nr:hypothetical protein JYG24_10430 [Lentisphaerota bacterium]WET06091.1 hypothetical protein P0136_12055 [Lentisphaerota bacterium ZTH]
MKKLLLSAILSCIAILLISHAEAISSIKVFSNKFIFDDGTNTRINIKGIDYQPIDNVDPVANDQLGTIQQMYNNFWKKANINAIRVYQVDPQKDHSLVMSFLATKGIYVMVGMVTGGSSPTCIYARSANQDFNFKKACPRVVSVAKEFNKYPNVLCYSVSNEVLAAPFSSAATGSGSDPRAASYVKAVIKYLKKYQQSGSTRCIPIGVVLRDDPSFTQNAMSFYICGSKAERADFIGYNCYRWGGGTLQVRISAYSQLYDFLTPIAKYVPVIFGEYGSMECHDINGVRTWTQVPYLFGSKMVQNKNMSNILCGGFAYRFFETGDKFGLINKSTMQPTPKGGWVNLINQYSGVMGKGAVAPNVPIPEPVPINNPNNKFNKPLPNPPADK